MESRFKEFFLHGVFTVVYFVPLFKFIQWIFANLPLNFALDLMSIVMCVMAFVVSVGLADRTVAWIQGKL